MITRSANHYYTYDGKTYPGVTGILSVIDKSGPLMSWAARQTAEAAVALALTPGVDGADRPYPQLNRLLDTVGEEGVIKALTARSNWKRDEAAALGTEVHNLADLVVRAQPTPPMGETTRHRVLAYADWWKASGWRLRLSEAMLVHPGMGYGGTLDLLAYDADGRTVLADIKTGKAVYNEAVLQLTAYGMAELIQPPSDNVMVPATVYPMPKVDRHVILHVTADGVREVEVAVGIKEKIAWASCIELAEWRESVKGKRL
jgi:hypothetical protein